MQGEQHPPKAEVAMELEGFLKPAEIFAFSYGASVVLRWLHTR